MNPQNIISVRCRAVNYKVYGLVSRAVRKPHLLLAVQCNIRHSIDGSPDLEIAGQKERAHLKACNHSVLVENNLIPRVHLDPRTLVALECMISLDNPIPELGKPCSRGRVIYQAEPVVPQKTARLHKKRTPGLIIARKGVQCKLRRGILTQKREKGRVKNA